MLAKRDRKLKFSRPVSLSTQVAEMLIQAILGGKYKAGDQLVENDLQKQFGMSRSPLREAFRELEKRGLVDIVPRKGTFVKRISKNDIKMHFPVRASLEALAAKLAFIRNRKQTAAQLSRVLSNMQQALDDGDSHGYYDHHLKYHEVFINRSGNTLLIELLKKLRMQNLLYSYSYSYYLKDPSGSIQIHRQIADLFHDSKSDSEEIRNLVEYHINVALGWMLSHLDELEKQN